MVIVADQGSSPHAGPSSLRVSGEAIPPRLEEGTDATRINGWDHEPSLKGDSYFDGTSPKINPFHLLSHPHSSDDLPPLPDHLRSLVSESRPAEDTSPPQPPLHITKVSDTQIRLSNGTAGVHRAKVVASVNKLLRREDDVDPSIPSRPMQEPPPSPPISDIVSSEETPSQQGGFGSTVEHNGSLFTTQLTAEPEHVPVSSATPSRRISSSSGSGRAGSLAIVRSGRLTAQREGPAYAKPSNSPSDSPGALDEAMPRIHRRSTNPSPIMSPAMIPPRSPLKHSQSTFSPSLTLRNQTAIPGLDGAALDSDILAQAETIRRERLERRQKKTSGTAGSRDEAKVLVGNLIGEDHVNYVLMYNMLTGIRIGVSRCQAKMLRPLSDEDYLARHKYSFDVVGNELTPSARYDFKFKDYAPWVFRDLREEHFHLDPADYLLSLTAKYILSELGSPGKSGSFFYFSRDYRFIIKTIAHSEHKFLRSILKQYHDHVKTNPHTLLSRFYGLHRVKLPRGRKIHFVIMNNLFPPHRDIHETYDLKGSAFGREYPEDKAKANPRAVLKDKNWVNRGRLLEFGPEKRALLSEQLRRDMEFLKGIRVMDYSLLVGIHNMERGNRDNLRENQLTVFHPNVPMRRKPSAVKPTAEASNVRKAIRRSDPKSLDVASQLPTIDSADRRHFWFYQDEGGMRATDEANQSLDTIFYLGIIDICTPYNTAKKIEHFWKSITEDRNTISCIDPSHYGQRFLNFMLSIMRGGDMSLRPEGLLPDSPEHARETTEKGQSAAVADQS